MVEEKWCSTCRWEWDCKYKSLDGINLSFLIANEDGTCQKFNGEPFSNLCESELMYLIRRTY